MSKSRADMTPEELEALRKEQRERKQRSRDKLRAERERQKRIATEQNDPLKRWERNRAERPDEYQACLDHQQECAFNTMMLHMAITNIKAGKAPLEPTGVELLDLCENVLNSIDAFGFDDHLYCPTEWLDEFQMAYESSLVTGKNREFYEFGVGPCRISRDLWLEFVELAGAFIKTIPDYASNSVAARMVGSMRKPMPSVDVGAMRDCKACGGLGSWMSNSMWQEYQAKGVKFRCYRCRDAERKSRGEATIQPTTRETIFDSHGRVKDQ